MVTAREYWSSLIGVGTIVVSILLCLGVFIVGYLPKFPTLDIAQQITVVVAGVMTSLFTLAVIAVFFVTLIAERPGAEWK